LRTPGQRQIVIAATAAATTALLKVVFNVHSVLAKLE